IHLTAGQNRADEAASAPAEHLRRADIGRYRILLSSEESDTDLRFRVRNRLRPMYDFIAANSGNPDSAQFSMHSTPQRHAPDSSYFSTTARMVLCSSPPTTTKR